MSNPGRIVASALAILTGDVVNRATTFVLYALVARHLGTLEFGQLSLALSLFYTFQVLAAAGLKTLITREVARDRSSTASYLVNGWTIVLVCSGLSIAALAAFVRLMGYSPETAAVILLLAAGLVPYALSSVCEAIFQAWERTRYIAQANVLVNAAKIGLAFLLLGGGYGLQALVLLLVGCHLAILLLEAWLLARHLVRPRHRPELGAGLALIRATGPFLAMDGVIALIASMNVVLLSKLASESEVGLYSAAMQLLVPVTLVYRSLTLAVFPIMCRRFDTSQQGLSRIAQQLIGLLLALTVPAVVGLIFLAEPLLALLYGARGFTGAAGALQLMAWSLIPIALTTVLGHVLWAGLREQVTLRIVAVDAVVNLLLGLVLISQLGLIGAALATVIMRLVDLIQHYHSVAGLLTSVRLNRLGWHSVLAGACMIGCLALVSGQPVLIVGLVAVAVYGLVLAGLTLRALGGPGQLRHRYTEVWTE